MDGWMDGGMDGWSWGGGILDATEASDIQMGHGEEVMSTSTQCRENKRRRKCYSPKVKDDLSYDLSNENSPVLIIDLNREDTDLSPVLDMRSKSLLDQWIHPFPKEIFLRDVFRQRALHVTGSDNRPRIKNLVMELEDLDPQFILNETSSENTFVWLTDKGEGNKINSLEIADSQQALLLHKIGNNSIYCRAPPHVEQPLVANLLAGTGYGCGQYDPRGESATMLGRGEVEIFMGTNDHTTQWHYDFQENFTVQLSGVKRWKLRKGTVAYPLRGCTPHYASPETVESQLKDAHLSSPRFQFGTPSSQNAIGDVEEVVLNAGDVLYFPAGMWHHVTTVEPGVSLNVSLMATNYATIACQALQHILLSSSSDCAWRETISGSSDEVVTKLQQLLTTLPKTISDFSQTYGAAVILPPILRHPPKFTSENNDEDSSNHHDENSTEEDEGMKEAMYGDDGDNSDNSDNEVLGLSVVDVSKFICPVETSQFEAPNEKCQLSLNPLAWVRPVRDVTSFYDCRAEYPNLYVININYAGNEMQESSVRLVVQDQQDPSRFDQKNNEKCFGPRELCYLYHGLYCWSMPDDVSK